VIFYFNALDNKDFLETENPEDQGNIFKSLAITIKQQKVYFKNKLSENQMTNLKRLLEIAKINEEDDEKFFTTNIFHAKGSGEFGELPKETDEFDEVIKDVEKENEEIGNEQINESKVKMMGTIKRGRGMTNVGKKSQNAVIWKVFKKELIESEILQTVIFFSFTIQNLK
jgi:hypothetical protein